MAATIPTPKPLGHASIDEVLDFSPPAAEPSEPTAPEPAAGAAPAPLEKIPPAAVVAVATPIEKKPAVTGEAAASVPGVPATKGAIPPALAAPVAAAASPVEATPAKRLTLFDLHREHFQIMDELDSGVEITEARLEKLAQTLVDVEDKLEIKAEGWAKWISQLERDAEIAKGESDRLAARKKSFENFADRLRAALCNVLVSTKKTKVKTALYTISAVSTRATVGAVDMRELPARFLVAPKPPPPPEPDKTAILNEWKVRGGAEAGDKAAIPGVTIVTDRKHLVIK